MEDVYNCMIEKFPNITMEIVETMWNEAMKNNKLILEAFEDLMKEQYAKREKWRAGAYRKAIYELKRYPFPIVSGNQVRKLPGIGVKLERKIDEIIETGKLQAIERRTKEQVEMKDVIARFMDIWGVGPSKAVELYSKGYRFIDDPNLKEELNSQQQIGLRYYYDFQQKIPRTEISRINELLRLYIPSNITFEICGSYRRGLLVSGDIDVLVTTKSKDSTLNFKKLIDILIESGLITDILSFGTTVFMGVVKTDSVARRIDIHKIDYEEWGSGLLYFTGSKEFNITMRNKARSMGYKLSEKGLFRKDGMRVPNTRSEREIFKTLNIPYVPPEDR